MKVRDIYSLKDLIYNELHLLLSEDEVGVGIYAHFGYGQIADKHAERWLVKVSAFCALHDIDAARRDGSIHFSWKE